MIINTKEFSTRIKLGTMLITLVILGIIVFSVIFTWSKTHILEYILIAALLLYFIFISIKKYYYIFYNSNGPKIIIRYSSLSPLSAGNYSVEIPKRDFVRYDIDTKFGGLRKELIMYVHTPQGVAKFRPVSLTTMTRKERENLNKDLSSLQE